jgi:hypothetical protein
MIEKFRNYVSIHRNFNLILSGISLVYIWRGVWSLTDMFTFGEYKSQEFWSYIIPMIIAFGYIYYNDYRFDELVHKD